MCANKYSSGVQRHIAFRTCGTLLVGCLVLSWLREGRRAGFWLNCFKCSLCLIQILFLTPYEYKGHTQRKLQLFFPFPLEMLFMGHTSVKGSIYLLDLLRILFLSLQKVLQGFLNLIHIQGGLNSSTDKHASQILLFLGSVKNSSVSELQEHDVCLSTRSVITDIGHCPHGLGKQFVSREQRGVLTSHMSLLFMKYFCHELVYPPWVKCLELH